MIVKAIITPGQFVLWLEKAMTEYEWFTDHGSVHQDRTSCRCLVRRSDGFGLRIQCKRWRQMRMLFLALVKRMDIGAGLFVVIGGCAPSGVYVNNNNYDNENIGVGVLRKFFVFPVETYKSQWGTDFIQPPIILPISWTIV